MRYFTALLIALGLYVNHALAEIPTMEEPHHQWNSRQYCTGKEAESYVTSMIVDIKRPGELKWFEQITSGTCKMLKASQVEFDERFLYNTRDRFTVIFDQYFDENNTRWLRWCYLRPHKDKCVPAQW